MDSSFLSPLWKISSLLLVLTVFYILFGGREVTVRKVLEPYHNTDINVWNSSVQVPPSHDTAPNITTTTTTQTHGCSSLRSTVGTYNSRHVMHWQPDWFSSEDNVDTMLKKRKIRISERCDTLKKCGSFRNREKLRGIGPEVWDLRGLRYCATYKAGYTFWKHVYRTLRTKKITSSHRKFTVIRNPWSRLVSVWLDRFSGAAGEPSKYMRGFCRGKQWPYMPPFGAFIEDCVLANWRFHKVNVHWAPVIERCRVCSEISSFDFFVSQENLNTEASYMLRRLNIGNITKLLTTVQSESLRKGEGHRAPYQQYYRNISSKTIDKIREIYKYELYLFDYPDTPFVDFPHNE